MRSLKGKLILTISLFIIALMAAASFLQIQEKERELIGDIFLNSRSLAELTADKVVDDYKLYLVPESFVYFNREVQDVFAKNEDLSGMSIVKYDGELVYDSDQEKDQQYKGEARKVEDGTLLNQVKSRNLSVKTLDTGEIVYFKKVVAEGGEVNYQVVDANENPIENWKNNRKIANVVIPADDQFSVIYKIDYVSLENRIAATQYRTILMAIFGVGLGIILSIIFGSTITRPLAILKKGADILATGNLKHRVKVHTKDEIFALAESFNKMAADLEISTKALVYKERVAKELELASQIQKQLLPNHIPKIKGVDISAGIIPAEEIGGDLYDFLPIDKNNMLFYLGDVTGHGVPSGIVVSIANALFYTYAGKKEMNEILEEVNSVLKDKTSASMFLTLVLMNWNAKTDTFSYVSAGHEQIIHYKAKEDKVEMLASGGIALGMIKDIKKTLKVHDVKLKKGDVLVVYSDGIPEAWNDKKELYGMERFTKMVREYSKFPGTMAIRNALLADVYMFRKGYKQMDDITSIVIKKD